MASVTMRNIRKTYDNAVEVIRGIDLEVQDGEFMVFVGPSGCGKSTMMRMIAGLEDITEGELLIGDRIANDLPPVDRGVAMVFQSYALYPHMTVAENMGFGLKLAGVSKTEVDEIVGKTAEILHISNLLDRRPKALSGGQRQRVAIGRAIVRKPGVFLFDEPLSNLDAGLRVQMRVELARLHKDLATTMVYVTHDQVEAMTLANRIVVLNQGRIEQVGSPLELYHHPANRFVAGFIGSPKMNFLPCVLVSATETGATVKLADGTLVVAGTDARGLAEGTALVMGIRPERIVAATEAAEGTAKTSVIVAEHLGDTIFLYVHAPGGTGQLTVKAKPENPLRTGDETHLSFPAKHCLLFGPDDRTLPPLL